MVTHNFWRLDDKNYQAGLILFLFVFVRFFFGQIAVFLNLLFVQNDLTSGIYETCLAGGVFKLFMRTCAVCEMRAVLFRLS